MKIEIFPSGPLDTNAYLVSCEKLREAVLIDAPSALSAKSPRDSKRKTSGSRRCCSPTGTGTT